MPTENLPGQHTLCPQESLLTAIQEKNVHTSMPLPYTLSFAEGALASRSQTAPWILRKKRDSPPLCSTRLKKAFSVITKNIADLKPVSPPTQKAHVCASCALDFPLFWFYRPPAEGIPLPHQERRRAFPCLCQRRIGRYLISQSPYAFPQIAGAVRISGSPSVIRIVFS